MPLDVTDVAAHRADARRVPRGARTASTRSSTAPRSARRCRTIGPRCITCMDDVDERAWDAMIDVNAKSAFFAVRRLARLMRGNGGGNIVLLGSIDGVKPAPSPVHYAASKAAVSGMVKAMAKELGPYNIRVNTIAPGVLGRRPVARAARRPAGRVPEALRPEATGPARRGRQRRGVARAREHPGHRADDRRGRCAVSRRGLAVAGLLCYAAHASVHLWRRRAVRPAVGVSSRGAAGGGGTAVAAGDAERGRFPVGLLRPADLAALQLHRRRVHADGGADAHRRAGARHLRRADPRMAARRRVEGRSPPTLRCGR